MAGRLELLDRVESSAEDRLAVGAIGGGDFGIGGDDINAATCQRLAHGDLTVGDGSRLRGGATGHGPTRQIGAAAADHRPGPEQGQDPSTVPGHQEVRQPARRPPVLGPRSRLVDVAAGRLDRLGIPAGQFLRASVPDVQSGGP